MPSTKITVEYVLDRFKDVIDSDANWAVKVRALELMGKYLNMFIDQKKVNIDVRQLIAGASLDELRQLAGGKDEVVIDVKNLGTGDGVDVGPDSSGVQPTKGRSPRRRSTKAKREDHPSGSEAASGAGAGIGHQVDQGIIDQDRESVE